MKAPATILLVALLSQASVMGQISLELPDPPTFPEQSDEQVFTATISRTDIGSALSVDWRTRDGTAEEDDGETGTRFVNFF